MSSNLQPGSEFASELLNFNMESISNELSALLIGNELDLSAVAGAGGVATATTGVSTVTRQSGATALGRGIVGGASACATSAAAAPAALNTKETEMAQLYRQYYYYQQQQQLQQQLYNATSAAMQTAVGAPAQSVTNRESALLCPMNANTGSGNYASVPPLPVQLRSEVKQPTTESTASECTLSSSPKFEFHFLRCQSLSKSHPTASNAMPLLSSATNGGQEQHFGNGRRGIAAGNGYRRFQKQSDTAPEEEVDYDKVVVDLSVLGLSEDNVERNPVLRLFALFRQMHYYLNDVFPSPWAGSDVASAATGESAHTGISNGNGANVSGSTKPSMPCTMNVQYQVKQAARKCTIFLCDMQRIVNANKMYSRELYLECEQSLNMLRKLLTQFEVFKRIELEHKRGQFVTEEARAQAECLETVVQQLNDQIRESHFYVHIFNWAVQRKLLSKLQPQYPQQQQQRQQQQQCEQANSTTDDLFNSALAMPGNQQHFDLSVAAEVVTTEAAAAVSGLPGASAMTNVALDIGLNERMSADTDVDRQSTRYIGYK